MIGRIPDDLDGVYLRNTENPVHPAIEIYHPFDGDGDGPRVGFRDGKAYYRNRFVRTDGFVAEQDGRAAAVGRARRGPGDVAVPTGWGARGRMKDASSTDVVVHNGVALTSFYQCGDLYRLEPDDARDARQGDLARRSSPRDVGVSAHPKVDERTGELLFFNYSTEAPYMHYGVVDAADELVHYIDVPLPGPRLPHDMAFTENYAILNDLPLFWEPRGARGRQVRRAVPPRAADAVRGHPAPRATADIRWFEAEPTYVLHWVNAYEDGDEIVLDGFFQDDPEPRAPATARCTSGCSGSSTASSCRPQLHRWRFNLRTGLAKEERLTDTISEFGMINARHAGARATATATRRPPSRAGSCSTASSSTTSSPAPRSSYDLRRGRVRQRDGDGAARRRDRRGRRLPGHDHVRREPRPVRVPGLRRAAALRRPDRARAAAGAGLQRHARDLGARRVRPRWRH